jgi:hypothetical protein
LRYTFSVLVETLERRMRPGADSVAGFLGPTESLERVLEEDAATLAELQISANALADRLQVLLDAYTRAHEQWAYGDEPVMARVVDESGATIGEEELPRQARPTDEEIKIPRWRRAGAALVAKRFQVQRTFSCGWQNCPWKEVVPGACDAYPRESATGDWQITNRRTGRELAGPDLIVHLIGAHGFFEGHGTSYRVDPRELTALLELGTFAPSPT